MIVHECLHADCEHHAAKSFASRFWAEVNFSELWRCKQTHQASHDDESQTTSISHNNNVDNNACQAYYLRVSAPSAVWQTRHKVIKTAILKKTYWKVSQIVLATCWLVAASLIRRYHLYKSLRLFQQHSFSCVSVTKIRSWLEFWSEHVTFSCHLLCVKPFNHISDPFFVQRCRKQLALSRESLIYGHNKSSSESVSIQNTCHDDTEITPPPIIHPSSGWQK